MRLRIGFPQPRIVGESANRRRRSCEGGDDGGGSGSKGVDDCRRLYRYDVAC